MKEKIIFTLALCIVFGASVYPIYKMSEIRSQFEKANSGIGRVTEKFNNVDIPVDPEARSLYIATFGLISDFNFGVIALQTNVISTQNSLYVAIGASLIAVVIALYTVWTSKDTQKSIVELEKTLKQIERNTRNLEPQVPETTEPSTPNFSPPQ